MGWRMKPKKYPKPKTEYKAKAILKSVKVLAFWTGARRPTGRLLGNGGPEEAFLKLKYIIEELEKKLDYGCPMDLIIINSVNLRQNDNVAIDYLNSLNGTKTKNGTIIVLHKENFGISFGAFSYAFNLFKDYYDYWFFSEDDYLTAKDGVMSTAISMLESDPNLGFIASVEKVGRGIGPYYARGGSGISSTKILKRAWPDGLPFAPYEGYMKRHQSNEKKFTRKITRHDGLRLGMEILPSMTLMVWGQDGQGGPTYANRRKVWGDSFRVDSVSSPTSEEIWNPSNPNLLLLN